MALRKLTRTERDGINATLILAQKDRWLLQLLNDVCSTCKGPLVNWTAVRSGRDRICMYCGYAELPPMYTHPQFALAWRLLHAIYGR